MASESEPKLIVQYEGGPYHGLKQEGIHPFGLVVFPAGAELDAIFIFLEEGRLVAPCYVLSQEMNTYFWHEPYKPRN